MKHGYIVSIPMLHLVKDEDFHLILPHLYKYEEYVQFYKNAHNRGAYITQDNSIFELQESADWELLMRGVRENFISEIVVPEVLRDYERSIEQAKKFVDKYGSELWKAQESGLKIAAVVQGKNYSQVCAHYRILAERSEELIGIKIDVIHIPFNFEFDSKESISREQRMSGMGRFDIIMQLVADAIWDKKMQHHLLGLFNPYELSLYKGRNWNIKSNDSSSCFYHSLYGVKMIENIGLPYRKIETGVDFQSYFKYSYQYNCFQHNKLILKSFC